VKVLLCIAEMGLGGAERVVVDLTRWLRERGDQVAVAAGPGPLDAELEAARIERHLVAGRGRSPRRVAAVTVRLGRAIRDFEPDLIHSHNVKVTAAAGVARRLAGARRAPLLATFHGVTPGEERAAARLLLFADEVVCVSGELAERLAAAGFRARSARVIHNAVPPPERPSPERRRAIGEELGLDGSPVISIVGRLVPQKAHRRFLEAMALVSRRHPDARFLVVGDGPLRTAVEQWVHALGLDHATVLTGARPDARELIASSDLLVFSSDWEGLSLAALEALAAGTPVVATDVAGMGELLATGAGVIVPPDASELADAVSELLDDSSRRAAMGRAGSRLAAERFSPEAMVNGYADVYARLVAARTRSARAPSLRRALHPDERLPSARRGPGRR
jgi:glycosyltransferase involved in cell wall biosynthesis